MTASLADVRDEPLTLHFQDVEVRAALQVLADHADINLVASDAVQGQVTLRLQDVPWEQALDLILSSKGLGRRLQGNVLLVAPLAELAERRADVNVGRDLEPLERALLPIHHAKASELASLVLAAFEEEGLL
ncbi:secretin and TonB N-terminal domain-containing protein, partial [Pseudomonas entomophila]|uniref:secretin and TonB N-terminal domain-containing protein n=1 Tax=Pseudomonas entomophila TaxID=312306 RepID=UPI0021597CFD